MLSKKLAAFLASAAISSSVAAWDFQELTENFSTGSSSATHFCITAEDFDSALVSLGVPLPESSQIGCKITNGMVIGSDSSGSLYALPDGTPATGADSSFAPLVPLTLVESNTQDIQIDGTFIGQSAGLVTVGTFTDYVLTDTRDGGLVLAVRVVLSPTVNGNANQYEVNNIFRDGFTGFSAAIGWSRGSDADLRLYNGTRTAQLFLSSDPLTYDPDRVRLQSDVNVSEGNPRSGFFFIKTDAPYYTTQEDAISFFQAGEEGQPLNLASFSGYVPSSTPPAEPVAVPFPLWGIGLIAISLGLFAVRSRS